MDTDTEQPPVCIESVESLLNAAARHLSAGRFREAIPFAETAQAYLVQLQRASPKSFMREMHVAKIIVGVCRFRQGDVSESVSLLVSGHISQEPLLQSISNEEVAHMASLAVVGSITTSRDVLVKTLTSFTDSACRDFLDEASFAQLRVLGSHVTDCRFRQALETLSTVAQEMMERYPYLAQVMPTIQNNFQNKCLADLIRCFQIVDFSTIESEIGIDEESMILRVTALIQNNFNGLSDRRIDLQNRRIVKREVTEGELLNSVVAEINSLIDDLQLEKFRQYVAERGLVLTTAASES